jgi:hypothetical protein
MATTVTLKPNAIDLSGSTSGTTTLQATAVAGTTTITLPAATDTLVGKATTDTLTNKTLTSPTLTTPVLGTPSSGTLTNCTGLPNAGLVNSSVTVGSTSIALGASATTVAGLTSLATNTLTSAASTALTLQSAGTTAITVDTSQNVGIGTTSPSVKLQAEGSSSTSLNLLYLVNSSTAAVATKQSNLSFRLTDTVGARKNAFQLTAYADGADGNIQTGGLIFTGRKSDTDTEFVRINSSGNLLVGTTSDTPNSQTAGYLTFGNIGGKYGANAFTDSSSDRTIIRFSNTNGNVGGINTNGMSTAYNTSSDYRLKENVAPMTGALAKVAQLKPSTYKWKADGSDGEGFIAHELAEVCPHAVSGTKDEVDADGNPQYQGIDVSFLVATLTAAIQEAKALIDTQAETINALTARVVALEAK